ncbi:MAG: HAMP domain-containing histidine kinase [Planctomycetaceae bacterium]|jgi:signal transduction histidine kinase|nr:HAMP domain-containing histidine kinase [Planctomycetaceae bacterium]
MDELEEQKLNALAEFAAGAGHEINNPLAIIAGRTQLLLREITLPEHRRQLEMIAAQVKRACEMIADIRFFARPPQPEISRFDLVEELKLLAGEHQKLMSENNARLFTDFALSGCETTGAVIESDPVLLHMAAAMLLNNAGESVQSGGCGGTVWLRLRRSGKSWKIIVEDDGPGVSEEIRPLIFDPYYSGRQAGRGLGFGLPKVWRIMQILGGSVCFEPPASFTLEITNFLRPPCSAAGTDTMG